MSALLWGSCVTLAVCIYMYIVCGGGRRRRKSWRGGGGGRKRIGGGEEEVDYCEGQLEHYVAYWW